MIWTVPEDFTIVWDSDLTISLGGFYVGVESSGEMLLFQK